MTNDEAEKILNGDPSGLEFMTEDVYFVCKAFIDIMDFEGTDMGHHKEAEWADAFVTMCDNDPYYSKMIERVREKYDTRSNQ